MKIIDIICDHDKRKAEVHYKRIDLSTGAYVTRRYQVDDSWKGRVIASLLSDKRGKWIKGNDNRYRVRYNV